ncbi:threonylcarbamoyl-AMP synthase [Candidatus Uhrbacteria bacterium]|nr:threonylcarbamoyl-AMP synthase [Candidatus Uhrbacteria bacterium]
MVQEYLEEQIQEAVGVLKRGGVVVFPTETAYGLAADATNEAAVERVTQIKGRVEDKSFPLIAASREMVERFAGIPQGLEKLVSTYWPGPLTLVLPVMEGELAQRVIHDKTVAIRVSSHPLARALSEGLGKPIVSTSANLSDRPACYSVENVRIQLGDTPDAYLDGGTLEPQPPSTIVTIDDYGYPEVIRQGSIEIDV